MKNNLFIIDTNTLISAFLFKNSNTRKPFNKATETGKFKGSLETYNELSEILLRPKFDKYISSERKLLVIKEFKELIVFIKVSKSLSACRDPKDNKFLELAISAKTSCIISGDNDLLVLHPFRDIPILNAVDFINNF